MPSGLNLRALRVSALLNRSSGSCDAQARGRLVALLAGAGVTPLDVWEGPGREVEAALDRLIPRVDVLVVLGGDGTIRAAAQRCGTDGPILVPLPGGTLNMLPKALYGPRRWPAALAATLRDPVRQGVDGGQVGRHRFYVAGVFGGASLFAGAREALRDGDLKGAVDLGVSAWRQALGHELAYRFDDRPAGKAEAVVAVCPSTRAALRTAARAPGLEVAAIDVDGAPDALRLAVASAFRDWRADATVTRAEVQRITLRSTRPIPAILDGEHVMLGKTAHVNPLRDAFQALRPR